MLFHEKLDIRLIRLVKDNPVLYDHNHAKYMDFNAREVAWQKIGDELKRSAADCKVRWINIRDVYRRILRKSLESGSRQKLYKYENEIAFLRPFYKDVTLQIEEFESDDRSNHGNEDCGDEGVAESENSDSERKPKLPVAKTTSKKKRRKRFTEPPTVDPMSTPSFSEVTVPTEFDSSDPVDAFLLSIGATLKTFSPYHLNLAKSKIFSVVQEHDLQQIVQNDQHSEATPRDIKINTTETIYMQ